MAFFGLFKKDGGSTPAKKGFHELTVDSVEKLTSDTVKITFNVPDGLKNEFKFIPGQYINIAVDLNGKDERRSYSICSGPNEKIAVAVKEVKNGTISTFLNKEILPNSILNVSQPLGNFVLNEGAKNVVAIAAGSGITPMMSIAKEIEAKNGKMSLFYGNRKADSVIFKQEIDQLKSLKTTYFLSGETVEGFQSGRIDKESFTSHIKLDLDLLKADAFFICGPEQMILDISQTLAFFGVAKSKIHFELFTAPVLMKAEEPVVVSVFSGESKIKAILDSEVIEFTLNSKGRTILDAAEMQGMDAPFSCRGGVCCSCRAKVLKGSVTMKTNLSLTEKELIEGYILTCQAHPSSEEVIVSFDE